MDKIDIVRSRSDSPNQQLADILIHVGETRRAILNIDNDIKELKDNINNFHECYVTKTECQNKICSIPPPKKSTGAKSEPRDLKYWIGIITGMITIIGFLCGMFWGIMKLGQLSEQYKHSKCYQEDSLPPRVSK